MQAQPGSTITWRPALGTVKTLRVEMVQEIDGERWLFSAVDALGNWLAVNQKYVLGVK